MAADGTLGASGSADAADPTAVPLSGAAMEFDGATQRVEVGRGAGDALALDGDVTLEGWIKLDDTASARSILNFSATGDTEDTNLLYSLNVNAGGDLFFLHETGAGTDVRHEVATGLATDIWYHVAAVRDDTAQTIRLYVNGQEVGTAFDYSGLGSATGGEAAAMQVKPSAPGRNPPQVKGG